METYRRHHSTPAPHSLCRDQNGDVSPESLEKLAYDPQDEPLIIEEINHIFDNFHIPVAFGARHRAPCPVWRSERIVLGNETLSRFANRIHVFQKKSSKFTESAESWANHGGAADSFKQTSRFFGHYMGYLSLRPIPWVKDEETRWVAVANICPPRFMNRPRYHVLTTVTGPSDGVMPFRATPYYKPIHMPQSSVGGEGARNLAVCLHASLYCALLLKSNSFHCTPVSSQDMLAILWKKTPEDGRKKKSMGVIARSGVTLNQALAVLKSGDVGAGGVLESFSVNPEGKIWQGEYQNTIMTKIEALTCITEYLSNGIPVIVGLRHVDQKINNHSALIIGMHHQSPLCEEFPLKDIEASRDLPASLILHDSSLPPFYEVDSEKLLSKTLSKFDDQSDTISGAEGAINILPILPEGTRCGLQDIRSASLSHFSSIERATVEDYLNQFEIDDKIEIDGEKSELSRHPQRWTLRIRLLDQEELFRRFVNPSENTDLGKTKSLKDKFFQQVSTVTGSRRFWCAEWLPPGKRSSDFRGVATNNRKSVEPIRVFVWRSTREVNLNDYFPDIQINFSAKDMVKVAIKGVDGAETYSISGDAK